jgi:hypothetical protein
LEYIPPLAVATSITYDQLIKLLDRNDYLIQDGCGVGEGIVIKNYDFYNSFNVQIWAKIVKTEFKEQNNRIFGGSKVQGKTMIEETIVNKYCTETLINKTYYKIFNMEGGWESRFIPRLLNTVYYDLISEESWNFIKEFHNPMINFKTLQQLVFTKVKKIKSELF